MSSGLLAILDDVSALLKATAASLDDVPAQVAKTTSRVAGIVIDDAAVTPKYVVGLDPSRELIIIFHIARSSLFYKLFVLSPVVMILGYIAPWIITPLLMIGGAFLCFEGYEKVHDIFFSKGEKNQDAETLDKISPEDLEKLRIKSAVRTDFILSAEIVAITYSTVLENPLINQIAVLLCVAILITLVVYGFVAFLVKVDDFGLYLVKKPDGGDTVKFIGRGLVQSMPYVLVVLSYVGTAAMLLVGAEIIVHGIPVFHHLLEALKQELVSKPWLSFTAKSLSLIFSGLIFGAIIEKILYAVKKISRHLKA